MKAKICSVVLIFFAVFLNAQNVNFLDLNLKNSILNITVLNKRAKDLAGNFVKVDANNDGEIQVSEAKNIGYLSLSNNNNITSLVGIEEFVNLTYLDLNSIKISSLDLSFNTKLLELKGNFTALTTMDLSKNVLLKNINLIFFNYFDTIDVSKNINLEYVGFGGNFTKVDISENTKVINVVLASSNLNQLKVTGCDELSYLGVTNPSQLSNLDLSTNLKLKKLSLQESLLTNIDLSKNVALTTLELEVPTLVSIDLTKNILLTSMLVTKSTLSTIDLSQNINLSTISFSGEFAELDFSKQTQLQYLFISDANNLTQIDLSQNINLDFLNVKSCLNLRSIFIKNGKKQTFGDNFSDCPNLKNICCDPSEVAHFSSNPNYTVVTDCSLLGSSEINGKENPILFFPNPADNAIYFKERVQSVSVFDLSGKLLKKVSLNDTKFQVSFLKKGTYILLIDHGKTTETRKLIKN